VEGTAGRSNHGTANHGTANHGTANHGTSHPALCGPGSTVLDIGGDRGAAIVFTERELCGAEMEIHEAGSAWEGAHVGVLEREVAGGSRWAAVFGPLWEGRYETRLKNEAVTAVLAFQVVGGRVTAAHWPPP
jgi:hypothetical protein